MVTTFVGVTRGHRGAGFLILVHEFGHFIVAKPSGMRVEEFSLGFGRYLVSKRVGETVYGISACPSAATCASPACTRRSSRPGWQRPRERGRMSARRQARRLPPDPEDRLAGIGP